MRTTPTSTKTCSKCKSQFLCGPQVGACWCNSYPPIIKLEENSQCLCPQCLHEVMAARINKFAEGINPGQAMKMDLGKYQTSQTIDGIDYYVENGNYVFTKWFHLKRGECCESGCRHCPYGFESRGKNNAT